MSIHIMSDVWRNSPSSGGRLLVLLALADRANDEGICWPGVNELSNKARLGPRQVERVLKELERDGEIESPEGKPSKKTPYRIRQNVGHQNDPTSGSDSSSPVTDSSVAGDGTPIQEPSVEPSKEPSVEEMVQDIWATYLEATGKKYKLDDKRRRHIVNGLKVAIGADQAKRLEKCKLACIGLSRSPWNRGDNPRGTEYLEIRYALKGIGDESDDERIERMAALAAQPGLTAGIAGIDPKRVQNRLEEVRSNHASGGSWEPSRSAKARTELEAWGYTFVFLDGPPWARLVRPLGKAA